MATEKCNTIHLEHLRWGKKLYPGPGPNWHKPGWTTMGLGSWLTHDKNFAPDIVWDFREHKPFPFKDGEITVVYINHLFEFLDNTTCSYVLEECYRALE